MKVNISLVLTLLLISSTGSAATDQVNVNNVTRNVPHPMALHTDSENTKAMAAAFGEMDSSPLGQLESENAKLKRLNELQEIKIKLLESRIRELEKK